MVGVLELMNHMQQQGEAGRARGQNNRLSQLASKAYGAPQADQRQFVQQAIQNDAATGMQLGKQLGDDNDHSMKQLSQRAALFVNVAKAGNPQHTAGMYSQLANEAIRLGHNVPTEYDPQMLPMLEQLANAGGGAAHVSSTKLSDTGEIINVMSDGRLVRTGQQADRQAWFRDQPGIAPGIVGKDGSVTPLGGSPSGAAPQAQGPTGGASTVLGGAYNNATGAPAPQGGDPFASLTASVQGLQVTSRQRTPERNSKVGGVPNSYHLTGQAMDILPPGPQQGAAVRQWAAANNMEVIDEGDHWHLEPRGRSGQPQAAPSNAAATRPLPTPSAPAGYRNNPDGTQTMIPGGPAQVAAGARAEAAAARAAAEGLKSDAKQRAELSRQTEAAASANHLISQIDSLTAHPGFADLGTVWGDTQINTPLIRNDAKDARAKLENVAGQVALATMARLKALSSTGATGFGSLTAPELKLLQNSIDTLQSENISNAQLVESLKNIRGFMDKTAGWKPAQGGSGGAPIPVRSEADYNAVPSGAEYMAPDGSVRRKR